MSGPVIHQQALIKPHWTATQIEYAQSALNFVQTLMNDHNLTAVRTDYANTEYRQHNRNMQDGIEGLLNYFETLVKRFPEFAYEVKHVMVDGEFVTMHSHATIKKQHRGNDSKGFNIIDTWRVQDGRLVEHWDAIQPLNGFFRFYYWMTGGKINNRNGVF